MVPFHQSLSTLFIKNKQIFNNGLHRFHKMLFKEFLAEVNSNKQKKKIKEEMFESTWRVIRSRQSQTDKQRSKEKKRTNSDLQNTTQIVKDWATQNHLKTWCELRCYGRLRCFTSDTVMLWSTDTSIIWYLNRVGLQYT